MEITHAQSRHLLSFFVQSIRNHPQQPVVISEGDSWFSFPGHPNLIDHLDELVGRRMSLLRLESSGDDLLDILDAGGIKSLKRLMRDHRPDVLLMSGGGNDIVGPELLAFINPRAGGAFDAQAAINTQALRDTFDKMKTAYRDLIAARDAAAPNCLIVTHGYGDVIPDGRKAHYLGFTAGPWMQPFLETRGYHSADEKRNVIRALLGRFNQMLDSLAGPKFIKVDVSTAIQDDEWNDEIHPTRKGFEDAARVLHAKLHQLLPAKF